MSYNNILFTFAQTSHDLLVCVAVYNNHRTDLANYTCLQNKQNKWQIESVFYHLSCITGEVLYYRLDWNEAILYVQRILSIMIQYARDPHTVRTVWRNSGLPPPLKLENRSSVHIAYYYKQVFSHISDQLRDIFNLELLSTRGLIYLWCLQIPISTLRDMVRWIWIVAAEIIVSLNEETTKIPKCLIM